MPTYEYRCMECSHQFERFQKMSDEPVSECELCGGKVKRLLFPVAVHYKGSGFYTTDYAHRHSVSPRKNAACSASEECGASSEGGCAGGKETCCATCSD